MTKFSLKEFYLRTLYANFTTNEDKVSYNLTEENDTLFIFFQWTVGKTDWKHNFMFAKTPYKNMEISYKVHRGFLKCWKSVEDIIIAKVTEKVNDEYKFKHIYVGGYSHGGALAMLCHEACWYHRPDIRDNIKSVGFAGPRVFGSFSMDKRLEERWKNFILLRNSDDIVTYLPPRIFGYRHVGNLVHIGKDKHYGLIKSHMEKHIFESLDEYEFNETWETILCSEDGD